MSLEYKILWVDDNIEDLLDADISSLKQDIENYIKSLGFIPSISTYENITSAKRDIFKEKFDLILSDYNMNGGNGDVLIKEIREGSIYTEVLFYTAQTQIEGIAKSLFADRVSFYNMQSDDRNNQKFKEKILWLVNQTIKKLQELNAVRGLVMAETSRLDRIIEDILIDFFNSDDDGNKSTLKRYILDKIKNSLKSNFIGDELKLSSKTDIEIVKSRVFDAYKKSQTLQKLAGIKEIEINFTHENYNSDVIKTRNELAHAKSNINDGVEYLLLDGGEKELKQEDIVEIRKNILKYDKILRELKDKI